MELPGTITAIVTPMKLDGALDLEAFKNLIENQISSGIQALVIAGSTGEASTLTHQEKLILFKTAFEANKSRITLIASTGTSSTQSTIELSQEAFDIGYRHTLLICPYGNKPTQRGLYLHYQAIAQATPHMQHILYSIPGRCVIRIENDTVIALSKIPNIIGLKDSASSGDRIKQLRIACGPDFTLLSSDDEFALECIKHGGNGVISVVSNIAPIVMQQLVHTALSQDLDQAEQINQKLQPLFEQLFCQTNPIPIKALLHLLGKIDAGIRLPLTWLENQFNQSLFDTYTQLQE